MALKPKHKGEDPNDIMTEMVEDPDALVDARTGRESKSIHDDLITQREYDKKHKSRGYKEYR